MTDEEYRDLRIAAMGSDLGKRFHRIGNECIDLHRVWGIFLNLYGTNQARFDIMNACAPSFFGRLQPLLLEWTLLHISRLTDQAKNGKKRNLSLGGLPDLIENPSLKKEYYVALSEITQLSASARKWRDKRIAHLDLPTAINENSMPLPSVNRKLITDCISKIGESLNLVELRYMDQTSCYNFGSIAGTESLLRHIRSALEYLDGRAGRVMSGMTISPDWTYDKDL